MIACGVAPSRYLAICKTSWDRVGASIVDGKLKVGMLNVAPDAPTLTHPAVSFDGQQIAGEVANSTSCTYNGEAWTLGGHGSLFRKRFRWSGGASILETSACGMDGAIFD